MKQINSRELETLKEERRDFILYIRSEKNKDKVREVFDTDVVLPELEKVFNGMVEFFVINIDDHQEILKNFPLPCLVLFKSGAAKQVLRGIKAWNEYLQAIKETYFGGEGNAYECPSLA
ncbi:MAG: thioredoxin [Aquificaceae bacterium]